MIVVYSLGSHFRYQKYVKKGYMEMRKWIYLVPFWSVPGRSTLHYSSAVLKKRLQDVFKAFSRRLEDILMSSIRLQYVSSS